MSEKLTRPEVREGAFLVLYQMMFGQTPEEIDELNAEAFDMAKTADTDEIVRGVTEHNDELCGIISKYSKSRAISRIAKVNLVILKIAVYEMTYSDKIPAVAAINEAVELAKKYSYKADSGFINGILNSYLREINGNTKQTTGSDSEPD